MRMNRKVVMRGCPVQYVTVCSCVLLPVPLRRLLIMKCDRVRNSPAGATDGMVYKYIDKDWDVW